MKRVKAISLLALNSPASWLSGETLPTELRVLKPGDNPTVKGVVKIGNKTHTLLPLNQTELGFDRIALDFEHNTVPGTRAYKESQEPRPVAAYGVPQIRADGLWIGSLEWTPAGRKDARNYIDLSPAPELDEHGEVVFLHSVALCRQGAVNELGIGTFSVELSNANTTEEDQIMEKLMSALRKAFKLADNATEADLAAALAAGPSTFTAKLTDLEGKITTLTAAIEKGSGASASGLAVTDKDKAVDDLAGKITTLTADLASLKTSLTTLNAEIEKRDRAAIVVRAHAEGKVIPLSAEDIEKQSPAALKSMVEKLEVTVPLDQRTPAKVVAFSLGDGNGLTDQDKKMGAKYGFSEEDIKKANGLK